MQNCKSFGDVFTPYIMHCRHLRKVGSAGMSRLLGLLETDLGMGMTGKFWVLQFTSCILTRVNSVLPWSTLRCFKSLSLLRRVNLHIEHLTKCWRLCNCFCSKVENTEEHIPQSYFQVFFRQKPMSSIGGVMLNTEQWGKRK